MRFRWILAVSLLAGCSPNSNHVGAPDLGGGGAGGGGGAPNFGGGTVQGGSGSLLTFAVFGDARPPNPNDTAGYPSAIISGIFKLAQQKGAQFVVGTGDYMFASTQSVVDAQVALFNQARANFSGPIYLTMGNHECTGYTDSNCPTLNETANIRAFMQLLPVGITAPHYRVDFDTPAGTVKFLFVAANAWSSGQNDWLGQALADATTATFIVRHEPGYDYSAPGVTPSDTLAARHPYTLMLLGHSHTYRREDTKHVISGNGGAPVSGGASYGFLLMQQQSDGSFTATEIDEASGNTVDTWRISAMGQAL
jgi:predicted phosphodiesterase